jgi:NADH-quinone oxidoreductase subunit D
MRDVPPPRTVVAAVGAGVGPDTDLVLDLGSLHPSAHGAFRVRLTLEGDRIATAEPLVGLLHRGAEKLFEVRDYRQIVMLANRHDWLSAFGSELGVVLAVERMLGLQVPERAVWARTLLAELSRAQAALLYLATACAEGEPPAGLPGMAEREALLRVLEEASGGRIHQMANRVGGLARDLPEGWLDRVRAAIGAVEDALPAMAARLESPAVVARTEGVGVLSRADAIAYGTSGPVARASGLDLDLRRDDPYLTYPDLLAEGVLRVPTSDAGDARARLAVLADQVPVSLDLVRACADRLERIGPGPVDVRLPKVVRAPEGATYAWTEGVSGANGYYLVSTAEKTPWRLKLRSASFNNVQALAAALPGTPVRALTAVLMSFFFVVGDVDK